MRETQLIDGALCLCRLRTDLVIYLHSSEEYRACYTALGSPYGPLNVNPNSSQTKVSDFFSRGK